MSPLDADTTVVLRIEEVVRQIEAHRLASESSRAALSARPDSHADPPRPLQPLRLAVGGALIRAGLWLTGRAPLAAAHVRGYDHVTLDSWR